MTDITVDMIDNASDADLLRYQQQLAQEAERVTDERKRDLTGAFTQATMYIASQANSNGYGDSYIDEAEAARTYMPDWLTPWLPAPVVKVSGFYVVYAETTHQLVEGDDNLELIYQPNMNPSGQLDNVRGVEFASMYGSVQNFLEHRLPSDLMEQVRRSLNEPEKRRSYGLDDANR